MFRWAILNPKENSGEGADVDTQNFFISPNPSEEEAVNFPSGNGNCFDFMNRQINRRRYGVMQQGKFILANDPASNNSRVSIGSRKFVNLWLPIRRQMKWANNVGEYPNTNIQLIYWFCQMGDKDVGREFTDGPLDMHGEAVTYFKDSPAFN